MTPTGRLAAAPRAQAMAISGGQAQVAPAIAAMAEAPEAARRAFSSCPLAQHAGRISVNCRHAVAAQATAGKLLDFSNIAPITISKDNSP